MRQLSEMKHAEIVALTNEEINRMIDYRCAEEGVKVIPQIYKEAKREYESASSARTEIRDAVLKDIRHHVSLDQDAKQHIEAYREYLKLSDGNAEIALRFYRKAYAKTTEQWVIAQVEIEAKIDANWLDLVGKDPEFFNKQSEEEE
jgi:hypothetical protein